jgi:hypothetical protein
MSFVNSILQPISISQPPLTLGQTVLTIGIDPTLPSSTYINPYLVNSIQSAATYFGGGSAYTRALGEVVAQGAASILSVVVGQESDLPNLFNYLIDQPFDVVLPVGLTANMSRLSLFGNFAYSREQKGQPVMVVMQVDTTPGWASLLSSPVGTLAPSILIPQSGPMSTSRYFVYTPDSVYINPNIPSQYVAPAANSIAGLMVRNAPQISATNETLRGVKFLSSSTCPTASAGAFTDVGYTVLRNSVRNGVVPYKGVTGTSTSPSSSIYSPNLHNLATLRALQYVAKYVRSKTIAQVGEPSNGRISGLVTQALTDLKTAGVILAFDANVQINQLKGSVTAAISVLPPYETQMVTVYTRINLQAR